MAKIRVLRVLEYTYESVEAMTEDMGRWQIGANAVRSWPQMARGRSIKSATMLPEMIEDSEVPE